MSTKNRVFKKLAEVEKVDLATQKFELALVDDAKKIVSDYALIDEDTAFGFVVKAEIEYKEVLNDYEQLLKKIEGVTPKLEKAIQEIGINRNNFGVLDDLDSRKSDIKERISVIKRNINDLKAINPS